jgi:hypothetical protein
MVQAQYINKRRRKLQSLQALHKATDLRNKMIRDLVLVDGRVDVLMAEIGYRFDAFHDALIDHQNKHKNTIQLAPRGWGKTTIGTIASAAVRILRNPNIRIIFASETITQASNFLGELKYMLTHSRVEDIFGPQRGDTWHENAITVRDRTIARKEKTVMCTGVDGSITSAHVEVLYVDDIVSLKNSRTEHNREKVRRWYYTTLFPCATDEDTEFHVLGTKYHPSDLYDHMMKNDHMFRDAIQIIPALHPVTDESNNIEAHTTKYLHATRKSMGRVYFNSQYNQNASGVQGTIFDERFFRHTKSFPEKLVKFTGVDLAIGEKDEHAKFAICTIGIDPQTFNIYVLKYYTAHLSLKRQDEAIVDHWETLQSVAIGIESNAFQKSKVQSLRGNRHTSHIPALPIYTQDDKMTSAQKLQVRFEKGQIFFHESERGGELEEQLLDFPNGRYIDLMDGLIIAIRTALRKRKKKRSRKEPGVISAGPSRFRR